MALPWTRARVVPSRLATTATRSEGTSGTTDRCCMASRDAECHVVLCFLVTLLPHRFLMIGILVANRSWLCWMNCPSFVSSPSTHSEVAALQQTHDGWHFARKLDMKYCTIPFRTTPQVFMRDSFEAMWYRLRQDSAQPAFENDQPQHATTLNGNRGAASSPALASRPPVPSTRQQQLQPAEEYPGGGGSTNQANDSVAKGQVVSRRVRQSIAVEQMLLTHYGHPGARPRMASTYHFNGSSQEQHQRTQHALPTGSSLTLLDAIHVRSANAASTST